MSNEPAGRPRALPAFPHAEPQPYHLMLRTWSYAWWKPVVGILIALVGFVVSAPLVFLPVVAFLVFFKRGSFGDNFASASDLDNIGPETLLALNLVLGSLILVTWFVIRVMHRMRPRWLTSVVPGFRWRFFFACIGLAVIALVAQVLVSTLLPGDVEGDISGSLNDFSRTTLVLAVIVLVTTPLQAAGEEYLFRGYLLQAVGSLFRNRWVAILSTALLFAAAHGGQNFPLFFDRFAFGLIAAWLVIRTGGLEAGIALHVLNNFLAFGFALAFGDISEMLNVNDASWWNILATVTQSGVYTVLVVVVARRMGLQTRTQPPVDGAETAPPVPVATP